MGAQQLLASHLATGAEPGRVRTTRTVRHTHPSAMSEPEGRTVVQPRAAPEPPAPDIAAPAERPSTFPGLGSSSTSGSGSGAGDDGVGQTVGRYQVLSRLGRGGMASVYRARDPSIGRDVAIKFLHAQLAEDDDGRSRFLREARAAGKLSHPHIVTVHDVGQIGGRPYMAMELIQGRSLAEELDGGKRLPLREVVSLGMQLARALDYAHAHGVVHRDIKPGNILREDHTRSVKVTDFGIAHVDDGRGEQRTQLGDLIGTPQYMSPEQARGDKLDGRSDLFSVGIVLYQALAGQRPFRGDNVVAIVTRIAREEPRSVTELRREVPASLKRVIDRCLAKSQEERFQTGRELFDALARVRQELEGQARSARKRRIVPLRVKWAAAMAVFVALVMGVAAGLISRQQQAALTAQVTENAASLTRFIAAQNAAAVHREDWPAVEVAVAEMMKTGNFERLAVVDQAGVVRASSVPAEVGLAHRPYAADQRQGPGPGAAATRFSAPGPAAGGTHAVLGFAAPITFQGTPLGHVYLGVAEEPLARVARLSTLLMALLACITVAAVAVATWLLANWFAKPVRLMSEAMREITKGRYSYRIEEKRNDEFGVLYQDFDTMARALQERAHTGRSDSTPPPASRPPTP
jgi:eukaryotic-like serine/threonine-protein kinase